MQWNSLAEFLAMGGYGLYVWGSFGVTALALAVEAWLVRSRRRAALRTAQDARGEDSHGPSG